MKTLIIVRNGAHSDAKEVERDRSKAGHLSAAGQAKVATLAELLKTIVGEQSVLILSTPSYRASETAAMLAKSLFCQVKDDWDLTALHEQESRVRMLHRIRDEGNNVAVLIVVGQEATTLRLPPMFSPDPDKPFVRQDLERGQARILDLTTGESRLVN